MAGAEDELIRMIVHVFDVQIKRKPWKVEDFLRSVVTKFLVHAASHDSVFRLGNAWHSKHENRHVLENVCGNTFETRTPKTKPDSRDR
jgi:hypothetical protein